MLFTFSESLSARRAWIEIIELSFLGGLGGVALRKESVDRNIPSHWITSRTGGSLSARRAWIEMAISAVLELIPRRSPQGERG